MSDTRGPTLIEAVERLLKCGPSRYSDSDCELCLCQEHAPDCPWLAVEKAAERERVPCDHTPADPLRSRVQWCGRCGALKLDDEWVLPLCDVATKR